MMTENTAGWLFLPLFFIHAQAAAVTMVSAHAFGTLRQAPAPMFNDPELNGKYLGTITKDFAAVSEALKEASYAIRKQGFSKYPIFPICRIEQPIGKLLIGRRELGVGWNFYVSFLDEFMQRKLIEDQEAFQQAYRDPDEFCCLFVIDLDFTNFVFIPFPED